MTDHPAEREHSEEPVEGEWSVNEGGDPDYAESANTEEPEQAGSYTSNAKDGE